MPTTIKQGIYDLLGSVQIDTKEGGRCHVEPWPSQKSIIDTIADGLANDVHEFVILKCRQVAACVAPETRILTADLRWVPIAMLRPGMEVVAFDEEPPGGKGPARQMRTATIENVVSMRAPTYRITFDDGRSVTCTSRHPWLSRKEGTDLKWRSIEPTARGGRGPNGNGLVVGAKIRTVRQPWLDTSYEDVWLGGMLDGEGSMSTIESIEPVGEQTVTDLQTSTGTYIAEGLCSHNTTVCSVIELFWALANPGVQAAIIADRTDNLERLRRIFAALLETLPSEWRSPEHKLIQNNRTGMAFANRSVIDLLAAGNNPDLGASRALNVMHATECSQWRSLAGVESLKASLARLNPHRLYIWESIANGFNWYYNHWEQAKRDRHMRAIFIGFWACPTYSIPKEDPDYKTYWDNKLMDDELVRARFVRQQYGVTVKPEQIAWWRRESEFRAQEYMLRHYPWTETECFIASGSGFFPAARTLEIAEQLAAPPLYKGYKYSFDEKFLGSRIDQVRDPAQAMLKVWEPPEPEGIYCIGIDPSGGGGGESDDHAVEVLRCYADRVVQVAEFQSNKPLTYQLAWVLAHLAGSYRDHLANLEVTGVGAAVLPEVRNLRQLAERGIIAGEPGSEKLLDYIGSVRWFLYKRPDTMGGAGNVIAWKANADNKHQTYSELRDSLMLRRLEIRSPRLVQQIQSIVEDEGWLGAGPDTGENDDLVSALVLAHHAWVEWRRPMLVARNLTWDRVKGDRPPQNIGTVLSFAFSQKIAAINRKSRVRRERF